MTRSQSDWSQLSNSPPTRHTLLLRVRDDHDADAWGQFVDIYAPLIHAYGRHNGLQDADAADLAQDVLGSVASAVKSFDYDPKRGSFRGWLFTITRNRLRQMHNRAGRREQASGGTVMREVLAEQPSREDDEEYWNKEHQWRMFHWAAEQVKTDFRDASWQAFWQTAVENRPAADVAEELEISVGAVYIAKSRVMAAIRERILSVEPDA